MVQDARKFKYSSDYPQPLVAYRGEYTLVIPQNSGTKMNAIKHNLPYIPLAIGKWSENQDFSNAYDMSSAQLIGNTVAQLYSDATNFYIYTLSNESGPKTFYFRFIAFAPPDYDGDLTVVQNDSEFRFNSDYNYLGVYKQGVLNKDTGGMVTHDLGYIPQCRAWMKTDVSWSGGDYPNLYSIIDPMIIKYNSGRVAWYSLAMQDKFVAYGVDMRYDDYSLENNDKIYYHIYTGEA